jgi:hypothetical protein
MILHLRPACLALAMLALAGPAAAQTWVYEPDTPRYYQPRVYDARAYAPVVVEQPAVRTQRTVVNRTVIPQGRGRAPIVKERIVTETTAPIRPRVIARTVADDYAYAGVVRREVVARPVVEDYAYVPPAPRARVVTRTTTTVVDDYAYAPRAYAPRVTESYAYQPVVTTVPAVRPSYTVINNRLLVVDPATGAVVGDISD